MTKRDDPKIVRQSFVCGPFLTIPYRGWIHSEILLDDSRVFILRDDGVYQEKEGK